MTKNIDHTETNPGMHESFFLERFTSEEQEILNRLKNWWYLTNSGKEIIFSANAKLSYFLMKPISRFSEMFNLNREIICVFSPYTNFEPRTLDAFGAALKQYQGLRCETICQIVISGDPNAEEKIDDLLKSDPEQPIVVPFTYEELAKCPDEHFIRNRFAKHFYTRDLFGFLSPLRKDLYFYGRSELIQQICNGHRLGEHTGLFGLRKSGKTSIIYAIERHLKISDDKFISIDCENPSIHKLRWNELLHKILTIFKNEYDQNIHVPHISKFTEKKAGDLFAESMNEIHNSFEEKSILIIFDEIERISPVTGSSKHWSDGEDFIYFWQTLRAFYQRNQDVFTYLLVGTNPSCVEASILNGHENPLFRSVPSTYVPPFDVVQVREMVRKLGRYIGLKFEESIYGMLTNDFGGHPFLIRQFCSAVHRECKGQRPITIDKPLYEKVKKQFSSDILEYLEMMVLVLKQWYKDEYDVLTYLAQGDHASFAEFAYEQDQYTRHLAGYGLICHSENGYAFNIESLKDYIAKSHKFEKRNMSQDEILSEISQRRNKIESNLRTIIKKTLRITKGENNAIEIVLNSIIEKRRTTLSNLTLEELLSSNDSPLFFLDLINIISREWEYFKNVFDLEKENLMHVLKEINEIGRPDAHANNVTNDDFQQLRLHFTKIEKILNQWE